MVQLAHCFASRKQTLVSLQPLCPSLRRRETHDSHRSEDRREGSCGRSKGGTARGGVLNDQWPIFNWVGISPSVELVLFARGGNCCNTRRECNGDERRGEIPAWTGPFVGDVVVYTLGHARRRDEKSPAAQGTGTASNIWPWRCLSFCNRTVRRSPGFSCPGDVRIFLWGVCPCATRRSKTKGRRA
jgi:hypothetical protein